VASGVDSGLTLPSIESQAHAYGIPFARIERPKSLHSKLEAILSINGPVICEIILPPTHTTLPKASVYKKEDGSFAARPMEDLAPFLDRDEFRDNMIVEILDD
jgi:acetolactate synthase-1/2/3 large subunit